jgi:poly(3-hydroxybutyrate) depolymerase
MRRELLLLLLSACGSAADPEPTAPIDPPAPQQTTNNATTNPPAPPRAPDVRESAHHDTGGDSHAAWVAADDAGPKPSATCKITKDGDGFFTRNGYVGFVPASYDGSEAAPLVVGMHGCGDSAYNFATWGVNPYDTRWTQKHIGISIDGATGASGCWSMGGDDAKVLAAIDDIMSCFWIHKHKIVLAGFSSGGELGYRIAMMNASRFAGLLVEDAAAYASSKDENALFAGATWKLPIAHRAHSGDTVFPLSSVQADWAKLTAAGFPLQTDVTSGTHDGTSTDWATWLLPRATTWRSP